MLSDSTRTPAMPASHRPHTHPEYGIGSKFITPRSWIAWAWLTSKDMFLGWWFGFFFSPELPTAHAGSFPDTFFPDISASQIITLAPRQPQP